MKDLFVKTILTNLLFMLTIAVCAQTSVQITHANDTTWGSGYCQIPQQVQFYADLTGSGYAATDIMTFQVWFGDGSDSTIYIPYSQLSGQQTFPGSFHYFTHTYQSAGWYSLRYILRGPDGVADTLVHPNQFVISDTCGDLSGKIYADNNGNCQYDVLIDSLLKSYKVQLFSGSQLVQTQWSDSIGRYNFYITPGNYTIKIDSNLVFSHPCHPTGQISAAHTLNPINDIGLTCNSSFDLIAGGSGLFLRPGVQSNLNPFFQLNSCQNVTGSITLHLNPLLTYVQASPVPTTVIGNQVTWDFQNINGYTTPLSSYQVTVLTALSAQIGDTLCSLISVNPNTGDANPSNNAYTVCGTVFNSYDPNIKVSVPAGVGLMRWIYAEDTIIKYTIHFQNCGNDTAYNISIIDTLDTNLDLSTFTMIGSDHFVQAQYLGNRVMKFHFPMIYLVDSATNPMGSMGWVQFKIRTNTDFEYPEYIINTAYIYFDFNEAIVTNTTWLNFIVPESSDRFESKLDLHLYPIPSDHSLHIEYGEPVSGSFMIMDITGRILQSGYLSSGLNTIDVRSIPSGIYSIQFQSGHVQQQQKISIIH
jgi:uncharacterized repeat protein (TIGR01451 family)